MTPINKAEQELREKIADTLPCFRDIFDRMPCPYDGACGKCGDTRETVDHLVIILKEAGYKSPEEVNQIVQRRKATDEQADK